jgi:hypothetical protein
VSTTGVGLAFGTDNIGAAEDLNVDERYVATATAAWYLEGSLNIADRFFLPISIRRDYGSAFGSGSKGALFPKISSSWLVSDEDFFHRIPGTARISNFRLRAALGQAGIQPSPDAVYRMYETEEESITNGAGQGVVIQTLGNPHIKPERSVELEGGFDLGLWNDRFTLEATLYRKMTRDALVNRQLPTSFGIAQRQENVGKVDNRGYEMSVSGRPIETAPLSWTLNLSASRNTNKLVTLGPNIVPSAGNPYRAGYPVNGIFERGIVAYADANHNGVLELSEIQISDSAVYLGQGLPSSQYAIHSDLSFFNNRLTFGISMDGQNKMTQLNESEFNRCTKFACRGMVDTTASLMQQAIALSFMYNTQSAFYETVSWIRLSELSLMWNMPPAVSRLVRANYASVAIMGRNLKLWTKYSGADPEVNTNPGGGIRDAGGIPLTRDWMIRVNLGY